jgi:hypothetical protein
MRARSWSTFASRDQLTDVPRDTGRRSGQDTPSVNHAPLTLIAVGNAGRQLLLDAPAREPKAVRTILLAKPIAGLESEPGDVVIHYGRDLAQAAARLREGVFDSPTALFGAAGGRTTSYLLLRLAESLSRTATLRVVIVTPFSWEDRRRQWRALYVRFRLRQMPRVRLAVVVTGRQEREAKLTTSMHELMASLHRESWRALMS